MAVQSYLRKLTAKELPHSRRKPGVQYYTGVNKGKTYPYRSTKRGGR